MKLLSLCTVFLLMFTGCSTNPVAPTTRIDGSATAAALAPTPGQQKMTDLQKRLTDAEAARDKAVADNKVIDRLTAEKDILQIRTQIAEEQSKQLLQNVEAYKTQITDKNKEISAAHVSEWQTRAYILAGILGFLALVAGAVAFGWPLLRSVAVWASGILGALALLLTVAAKLMPLFAWVLSWIPYIAGAALLVAVIYGLIALRHWWLSHHTAQQLVKYVEAKKPTVVAELAEFKDTLRTHLDAPIESFIWRTRKGLGLVKNDVTEPISSTAPTTLVPAIKE